MWRAIGRAAGAMLLPLLLTGCFLTPGKFASTLTVNADRTFAFTYQGEVIALDLGKEMAEGMKDGGTDAKPAASGFHKTAAIDDKAARQTEFDRKCRAIAEALRKEAGYKAVAYLGSGKFTIDYAIAGTLTHGFVYPFNMDAEAVFPFIAVELRADGKVRVRAPAFAREQSKLGELPMGDAPASQSDGTFTLDTDAEIVSQNNEGGATTVAGRKRIVWTVTPLSKEAPSAVLALR